MSDWKVIDWVLAFAATSVLVGLWAMVMIP